jgi:predicted permease
MSRADPPKWRRYLRFWRADVDADIDDELRFHFESRLEELRARGLSDDAARAQALEEFGDPLVVRDRLHAIDHRMERNRQRTEWRRALAQDVRFASRGMRRQPAFTLVAVATLALGIGANAAIFSVVSAVLLRPLPFREPERLVSIWPGAAMTLGVFTDVRRRVRTFEDVAGYSPRGEVSLTGTGREPARVEASRVTANFIDLLGVRPAIGRAFAPGEDRPGRDRVALISHGLWARRLGADSLVIGSRIDVDGLPRTVVGVMPPGFRFPSPDVQLWLPITFDAADVGSYWGYGRLAAVARLRPDVSVAQARAEAVPIIKDAGKLFPWRMPDTWGEGADVIPLHESLVGSTRHTLLVLLGAVGLLLVVACVNVANLLLGRAASREREFAIRGALGAGRGRLARQLLTESLLLAAWGTVAGLAVAHWSLRLLVALLPAGMPRLGEIAIDGTVFGFAATLALVTGVAFGLAPAARAARPDLRSALGAGGRGSDGGASPRRRLSAALVVAQVALAVILVTAAGLLIKSVWRLHHVDPGFRAEHAIVAVVPLPSFPADTPSRARIFYDAVVENIRRHPGVRAAAVTSHLPLSGRLSSSAIDVEGHPTPPGGIPPTPEMVSTSADYLRAMGIPLLAGRALFDSDREDGPWVALVDQTAARQLWPGESPVGKRLKYVWQQRWITVVGVVGSVKRDSLSGPSYATVYRPMRQGLTPAAAHLVVRTDLDAASLSPALRAAVGAVDPNVPVTDVRRLSDVVAATAARARFTMLLLSCFAAVALLLGAVGIYGVVAYAVARRTREIGVRMALGADSPTVLRMVLRDGGRLAALGVLIGLAGALAASRVLAGLLFGVAPWDAQVFVLVPVALGAVALFATFVPARRAAHVDPLVAIRAE